MSDTKSQFNRYIDPTGEFSNRRLLFATWFVSYKSTLRLIIIILLIVWNVITIGIGLFVWGKYVVFDYARDEQMIASISYPYVSRDALQRLSPVSLDFSSIRVYDGSPGRYDFVVDVANPNTTWSVTLRYRFRHAGGETREEIATILPGATRAITSFGHEYSGRPGNAQFEIIDTSWRRIDPHTIPNPETYISQRVRVSIDALEYLPANFSEGRETPFVKFSLINESLFGYWEFPILVRLQSQGQEVGIVPVVVRQFESGRVEPISLGIFFETATIDGVVIDSVVNVFDAEVYLPVGR